MKQLLCMLLCALMLALAPAALGEGKYCWALEENGSHMWEQTDARDATCTEDGYNIMECTQCGYWEKVVVMEAMGHKWVETYREQPTDFSAGIVIRECMECGKERTQKLYPEGALYKGVSDVSGVKQLQQMLTDCGYLDDKVDGKYGANTEAAVKAFQIAAELRADGVAWPQTIEFLTDEWNMRSVSSDDGPVILSSHSSSLCYVWEDEDGTSVCVYCQKHADIFDEYTALLAAGGEGATDAAYRLWRTEIARLYDEWINLLPESDAESVIAAKALCMSMMELQRSAMTGSYAACATGISHADAEYGMGLWMRAHAAWLCQMIDTLSYAD